MKSLLRKFKEPITGNDEFTLFANFYEKNKDKIIKYYDKTYEQLDFVKSEVEAQNRKLKGNDYYKRKDLQSALSFYNGSLHWAPKGSATYSLTLANRSAVHFELQNYKFCISDIEQALEVDYPEHLKPKVYIRKAECHARLGEVTLMEECKTAALDIIDKVDIEPKMKEKYLKQLNDIVLVNKESAAEEPNVISTDNFEENPNFLYASSAVRLDYNLDRGRHVRANRNIKKGEILFKEKAFVFCTFGGKICDYCLSDIINPYYCRSCIRFGYCSVDCSIQSWNECHKYECHGMQNNFWALLGIGHPAFKALLKGINCNFKKHCMDYEKQHDLQFGSLEENYPYFNCLITNIEKREDLTPFLATAALIVTYLHKETTFFADLSQSMKCTAKYLTEFIGSLLLKHVMQLTANASVIEHFQINSKFCKYYPYHVQEVASGAFLSISMMNHSCKPQISIYYIKDEAIVTAITDIPKDGEVFNCYGIDYRYKRKTERQGNLFDLYYFNCKCEICDNPNLEITGVLNSYLCPSCEGPVQQTTYDSGKCLHCEREVDLIRYLCDELSIEDAFSLENWCRLNHIDGLLRLVESTFYKYHSNYADCYELYTYYYTSQMDLNLALQYFEKYMNFKKMRFGDNAKQVAIYQLNYITRLIDDGIVKKLFLKPAHYKDVIEKLALMLVEVKTLLPLYYPENLLHLEEIEKLFKM